MKSLLSGASILVGAALLTGCTTMDRPADTTMAAIAAPKPFAAVPLIERAKLFGNPTKASAQLSPDGKWLSWLAPRGDVLNVYVAPVGTPDAARAMTNSTDRPIRGYGWSGDGKTLLYVQDKGGDENFLLYGIDVASGAERTLTPFEKTRAQLVGTSSKYKSSVLVGVNNRDPRWHDIYRLDLPTGKMTEVIKGDGYAGFLADDNLDLRLAMRPNAAGGVDYFRVVDGKVEEKAFGSTELADSLTTNPAGFTNDGKTLYWIDSRGRNTAALVAQDVASGTKRIIAESDKADIAGAMGNPKTGVIDAYAINYLKPEWTAIDSAVGADLAWLDTRLEGEFSVSSRTEDDSLWIVGNDPVVEPSAAYLFDRKAKTLTKLYTERPELIGAPLVAKHPVVIKARDGLDLVSYLSLPKGADPDGDGKANASVPMVLVVHGGPWGRDGYGYSPTHQWLANRGYAVLSVNFRGSTGFGKDFISAGDLEWGKKMQDDLIDAVDWAVQHGITTPDKVAIMGGSYGGYATLAGLAFTPEQFACGVDIVGPSNLETLLKTIPPYWTAMIEQFHQRMGDPRTPEGMAMLKERSPLYSAGDIVRPLLIGQGANDPRVNQAESDQIVAAMKARGIPVTYVLFPDEGHGFAKPDNNIAFNAVAENFLSQCLGGRAEPIGGTVAASTAKIVEGADFVPGLATSVAGGN